MVSTEILSGKRKHELILLDQLLSNGSVSYEKFTEALEEEGCSVDENILESVQRIFDLSFFTQTDQKKYGNKPILEFNSNGYYLFNKSLKESVEIKPFFKKLIIDVVKSGMERSEKYKSDINLTRYEKYTRKDACKLLNWKNDESATMYG